MKLVVVLCYVFLAVLLPAAGEPVINGEDTGRTSGYCKDNKKNIVGRENYPYMIHLEIIEEINEDEEYYATCGGTLVSGRVVLSAAHCLAGRYHPFEVYAVSGILDLKIEAGRAQAVKMYDYLIHEDFANSQVVKSPRGRLTISVPNDIALIWMEEHFSYNQKVRHIGLVPPNLDLERKTGFILGWGRTEKGTSSRLLQKAAMRVNSKYECEYTEGKMKYVITNAMLCLKSDDEQSQQCSGDSGGPFIVNNKLAGIISYSYKKNVTLPSGKVVEMTDTTRGAVVTNVGFYNQWIQGNINRGPPKDRKKKQIKLTNTPKQPKRRKISTSKQPARRSSH